MLLGVAHAGVRPLRQVERTASTRYCIAAGSGLRAVCQHGIVGGRSQRYASGCPSSTWPCKKAAPGDQACGVLRVCVPLAGDDLTALLCDAVYGVQAETASWKSSRSRECFYPQCRHVLCCLSLVCRVSRSFSAQLADGAVQGASNHSETHGKVFAACCSCELHTMGDEHR